MAYIPNDTYQNPMTLAVITFMEFLPSHKDHIHVIISELSHPMADGPYEMTSIGPVGLDVLDILVM